MSSPLHAGPEKASLESKTMSNILLIWLSKSMFYILNCTIHKGKFEYGYEEYMLLEIAFPASTPEPTGERMSRWSSSW